MLAEDVAGVLDAVPVGCVTTYKDIAVALGIPRNARQVGRALGEHIGITEAPWWRCINSGGTISLTGSNRDRQKKILESEGHTFSSTSGKLHGFKAVRHKFTALEEKAFARKE